MIAGLGGNDTLIGLPGDVLENDASTLTGEAGDDTIYGGTGEDAFVIFDGSGVDRIMDFNARDDVVVVEGASTAYTVAQQGADTVITVGANAQMILVGVQASGLPPGWILNL